MKFSSVPVWSMGEKLPARKPEEKPGPGNYNSKKGVRNEPNFSFGKSVRPGIADGQGNNIGPGNYHYNPSSLGKLGGAPMKARQRNPLEESDMPGPGAYTDKFSLGTNNGYSLGKEKRQGLASNHNPTGPGNYNPRFGSVEPNSKKAKFGTEQRLRNAENNELNIGPGAYNWDKGLTKGGYVKFGKDDRNTFGDNGNDLGPGSYNTNQADLGRKKAGWTIQKRNRPLASGTGEVPGPGNYKSTGTLATGGYKLGKEQRKGLANENSVPGPGMYSKRDMLDNHGTKFGKDTRKTIEDSKINIGPGQYNFMDNKNQVGSYSFGKGQRSGMGNSNGAPGPGQYQKANTRNTGGWSMGKAKRPAINGGSGGNDVGPGQYAMKKNYKGGYSFGKDNRKTVDTHYTPGFYDIPATVPDVPKYLLKY